MTYTLAFLSYKTSQRINLDVIWREQAISAAFEKEIESVSRFVQQMIVNPPNHANISEWCKKEKCWEDIRNHDYELGDEFQSELKDLSYSSQPETPKSIQDTTEEEQKLIDEALQISSPTWYALSKWAKETGNFTGWQRSLTFSIGTIIARKQKLTYKQALQGLKVYRESVEKGFIA